MARTPVPVTMTATIRPLPSDARGNLVFECVIGAEGDLPSSLPQPAVRFSRVLGSGAPNGTLTFEEEVNGAARSLAQQSPGTVDTTLTSTPVQGPSSVIWFCVLRVPPDTNGKPIFLRASGNFTGGTPKQLQQLGPIGSVAQNFNPKAARVQILAVGPVPRLCVALNAAPANQTPVSGTDQALAARFDVPSITAILDHVVDRLFDGQKFYNAVWGHQTGKTIPDIQPNTTKPQDAEELWARTVSEMLLYTPYGIPTNAYGAGRPDFAYCAGGIQQGATANPLYGLSYSCESLATFGMASRGLQKFTTGIEAGSVASAIAVGAGATWFVGEKNPTAVAASAVKGGLPTTLTPVDKGSFNADGSTNPNTVDLSDYLSQITPNATPGQPLFGPGSVLLFSNRAARTNDPANYQLLASSQLSNIPVQAACTVGGTESCIRIVKGQPKFTGPFRVLKNQIESGKPLLADHTAGAHIGFVLRVTPDRSQFQVFDTGGLNSSSNRNQDQTIVPASSDFHSGIFDDPLSTSVKSIAAEPFRGAGVLPKPSPSDYQTMLQHIQNVLLKARPLGLARFILVQRGAQLDARSVNKLTSGFLVYASPAIPTYGPNVTDNFAISRYLWSLRDLPGRQSVQAFWLLYTPRGALASAMLQDSGRTRTLAQLATLAFQNTKSKPATWTTNGGPNVAKLVADLTLPILHCTDGAAGNVTILSNNYNKPQSMNALHLLEGRELNGNSRSKRAPAMKLPMDSQFLFSAGSTVKDKRSYLAGAGTPTVGPS